MALDRETFRAALVARHGAERQAKFEAARVAGCGLGGKAVGQKRVDSLEDLVSCVGGISKGFEKGGMSRSPDQGPVSVPGRA